MDNTNTELLTPYEVADLLKINVRTVYRWIESGEIPAMRFGDVWRIDKKDIVNRPKTKSADNGNGNHKTSES